LILAGTQAVLAAAPAAMEAQGRVARPGNVHPLTASARPLGPVTAQAPMDRMILALRMAPEASARLEQRLAGLQDPDAPGYHQWLTPEQFGAEFGPSPAALARVTDWLQDGGFTVDEVAAGRMAITFSGTVAAVERAFRTPILKFELDGKVHQANLENPSIPAALADVVEGVVSLHDFPYRAMNRGFTPIHPGVSAEGDDHTLTPGDFATIYNVKPLYRHGLDGTGVAIAVVGRTHIPLSDPRAFRKACGLPARDPEIILNGPDPGDQGGNEDGEADLDAEWSGAVARNATVKFVVSASTKATDGVNLSAQYIVDHNLAPIMTTSFGECETQLGGTQVAFFKNLWAQAAAQGITSFVASGDSGPAGCEGGNDALGSGQAVSGLASTLCDVAVGGSQFNEGSGVYWSAQTKPDGSSALGYIPEVAWNESGSAPGGSGLWATGGGPSRIYPRPVWQCAKGVSSQEKHRTLPDVSLTAAGHDGYLIQSGGWAQTVGGTSCSCPAWASLMALVVQKTGERQGNANVALYRLGRAQYLGTGPQVFHDILSGDSSVPGTQGYPCTPGYDQATGLGSVDAQALVQAWSAAAGPKGR
jgi:subtilase family serine protease